MSANTEETPPSLFTLPHEIILIILARVTRKHYPILSCVSKKLRSLLNSSEFRKTRYLLGKRCFYVCLEECVSSRTQHWFSLNKNRLLEPISTPSLPEESYSAVTMVGPEIYFLCSFAHGMSMMMIFDPRSGKLRQGSPRRRVLNCFDASMGLVDDKIYVFGSREEKIRAQILDLKTQTWHVAPTPTPTPSSMHPSLSLIPPNIALVIRGGPINTRNLSGASIMVYDPRDGKCEYIKIPAHFDYGNDVCVIDNVMYMYCHRVGLMWFNTKTQEWRVVHGSFLHGVYFTNYSMVEYNGKLMFLWKEYEPNQLCSAMILPYVSGEEIHARLERYNCILSDVKYQYHIKDCLSRMD